MTSLNYTVFKSAFEKIVNDNFEPDEAEKLKNAMDWDAWIYGPGLAPVWQDFTTPQLNESSALADEYIQLGGQSSPSNYSDYLTWYSSLKVVFLNRLLARVNDTTVPVLQKIDSDLNVTETVDPDCKNVWYPLGIYLNYSAVLEPAHTFICSMGRMKYLTPIYTALLETGQRDLAIQWFNENLSFYHPYAIRDLSTLLGLSSDVGEDEPSD